jgi:DivIVA domain-containing protein
MTTSPATGSPELSGRLTPADVHGVLFSRARLGRRGYDEIEVDEFLDRVQFELSQLIAEKGELRDEVTRLQNGAGSTKAGSHSGPIMRDEASLQAVRILSAAQQTADQYVSEAEHYSRRMSVDARQQYEDVVAEAKKRAEQLLADAHRAAQEAVRESRSNGGGPSGTAELSREELEDQVAYLRTFGQVCRVQLRSYLEALLRDVEEEWGRAHPGAVVHSLPGSRRELRSPEQPPASPRREPTGDVDGAGETVLSEEPGTDSSFRAPRHEQPAVPS